MPTRNEITRAALDVAARHGWPLFTGNGFLCREVMAQAGDPGSARVLPLHGGMGLAGGVAAGYLLAGASSGAIVLEGDGNHLMGWGCAQFIGALALPVIHLVACNGTYQSTGGQAVPGGPRPGQVSAAAATLGYSRGLAAVTAGELPGALEDATMTCGPVLLYVTEEAAPGIPPRSPFCTADYAYALTKTAAAVPAAMHTEDRR